MRKLLFAIPPPPKKKKIINSCKAEDSPEKE